MKIFGGRGTGPSDASARDQAEIIDKLDSALTSIFSEDGKRTVLYYLSEKYGLSLEQASTDPAKLEKALTGLLGEIGWTVVKKAILEHFWELKIPKQDMHVVESASLREVFGFGMGLGIGSFLRTG